MKQQYEALTGLKIWKKKRTKSYVRTLNLKVPYMVASRFGDIQGIIGTTADKLNGDRLTANIEEAFCDGVDEALKTLPVNATLDLTFENVIARINKMLKTLLSENGLPISNGDVHGVIVAQKGRDVVSAVWGKPSFLLFRRGIEGGPKLYDLLKTDDRTPDIHQESTYGFSNLISGKITSKDRMLIANRNLLDLLDKKAIEEILSAPYTSTVSTLLKNALLTNHEDLDLALLLLDGSTTNESFKAESQNRNEQIAPEEVNAELTNTETITRNDQISSVNHSKKVSKNFIKTINTIGKFSGKKAGDIYSLVKKTGLKIQEETSKQIDKVSIAEQTKKADKINNLEAEIIKPKKSNKKTKRTSKSDSDSDQKNLLHKIIQPIILSYKNIWGKLPIISRKLLLSAIAILFILGASLTVLGWQKGQNEVTANYEKIVSDINQKIDSAEASLIYRDEDRAKRLIEEASATIALLPEDQENQIATKVALTESVRAKLASLRRVINLSSPEVLSTIVSRDGETNLQGLIAGDGTLWANTQEGNVYSVSPSDGSASIKYTNDSDKKSTFFLARQSGVLLGFESSAFYIPASGSVKPQTINADDLELNITDADIYGSGLYILDAKHNRILKFAGVDNGYTNPKVYLKDGTDVSQAISMAIDGYIYILNVDGQISRLLSGKKTDFKVGLVDPPLANSTMLHTPDDKSDLYILESSTGRVVRFSKSDGRLVAQYESSELENATEIQIDEKAKTILAVKDNKILRFSWGQ